MPRSVLNRLLRPPADFRRVQRQSWPESCGAAALATLLAEVHALPVTEADVLERLGTRKVVGLDQLQQVCAQYGLRAFGYALDWDGLGRAGRPALLHLPGASAVGHFAVLRGIGPARVWLADPARGNLRLARSQFLRRWAPRGAEGRALYVAAPEADWLPLGEEALRAPPVADEDWFPARQSPQRDGVPDMDD
ncbi:bacteriocin resistance protein, putative [Thioalkalivibrio nitratireducens DSM 14787]|uniref:Bacteriocin resistance protein, putative n=1 Tax=Thioalkalivibrio nitratireducens (strain DSM 14787 / UNIQEM 213 / ALEN2) TaxID=1255043 RepID=L0DX14_THIND|nr:cysteine peptidase family C39 domain-containing protein [Thioalkalivibrio nitratireducens]AGA34149.1 bacteriocin resistance protein, putative [Thioalkalivibrio nitratireducens DSM 14787]